MFIYVGLTRQSAKSIVWNDIIKVIEEENLKDKYIKRIDLTLNTIEYNNGNIFKIYGAKDMSDIEKIRGHRIRHAWIDEAQSFKDRILKYLIDEILLMALAANNRKISLTGTPNALYRILLGNL